MSTYIYIYIYIYESRLNSAWANQDSIMEFNQKNLC